MSGLKVGDSFPEGVKFSHVAPSGDDILSCGVPGPYDASAGMVILSLPQQAKSQAKFGPQEFRNKKVVLVAVPGAFTPTCQASHLPSYINNREALKAKGVDQVVVIAYNDAFVMSAWGKANNVRDDFIIFADDNGFSKSIGWTLGERTARYAIAVDHGKVVYAEKEDGKGIEKSGAEAVLAKL